jgi:hypothetical protein
LGVVCHHDCRLPTSLAQMNRPVRHGGPHQRQTAGGVAGGGKARAFTSDWKLTFLWLPSQKGLFSEWPHRQRLMEVRPARSNTFPSASTIVNSPSIRNEPLLLTVIFVNESSRLNSAAAPAETSGVGKSRLGRPTHARLRDNSTRTADRHSYNRPVSPKDRVKTRIRIREKTRAMAPCSAMHSLRRIWILPAINALVRK